MCVKVKTSLNAFPHTEPRLYKAIPGLNMTRLVCIAAQKQEISIIGIIGRGNKRKKPAHS